MIRAAVVLVLALGAWGGAAATSVGGSSDPILVLIQERWLGFTACENQATAWIRADVVLSDEGLTTLAHELAHKQFMNSFPNCASYKIWRTLPGNQALVEAHGHCAGAIVDTKTGRVKTWDGAIQMHSARLAYGYPAFGLTQPEAEALIRRFCTAPPEVRP